MSVHVVDGRAGGTAHEVRWRTLEGRQRSRSFDTPEEAAGFDAAVRARLALERAQEAWSDTPERWRRYVVKHAVDLL